ncbi:hypothetical protein HUJ05_004058 [Dendroctonus ponderosae]|nr:hypothetical protein HUJ05_004058 [Dendroctonus ponderosae]
MMDGLDTYESTYPLFPADNDTSNYANELRTVVAIIERWLYSQGYFYQNYYKIPMDIARPYMQLFLIALLNNACKILSNILLQSPYAEEFARECQRRQIRYGAAFYHATPHRKVPEASVTSSSTSDKNPIVSLESGYGRH